MVTKPEARHDDVATAQRRLDEAYTARTALAEQLGQSSIPNLDQYSEQIIHRGRTTVVARLFRDWTPFFGRLDRDRDDAEAAQVYIGPYAVHAVDDDRLLIQSWRAPDSAAFYEATADDSLGVRTRRRYSIQGPTVTGVAREDLAHGQDDPDSLRNAIVRQVLDTRTGSMQDIMTTITPEQHRVIRVDTPVTVLQGGPGTGKTAVGLHRIAYLLFSKLDLAALIVGPSDRFIDYVGQVLPALGEDSVAHMTMGQIGQDPTALAIQPRAPRHLLGNARMAPLLDAYAWSQLGEPTEAQIVKVRNRRVTLRPEQLVDAIAAARVHDPRYGTARTQFRANLIGLVAAGLQRRLGLLPSSDVIADISRTRDLTAAVNAVWPAVTARDLLRRALADRDLIARFYDDPDPLHRAVRGTTRPRPADTLLTALEELAGEVVGAEFDGRRYDHVVVDEAQELTAVELRMVRRRVTASGHLTLLGDLSQQMGTPHTDSWEELVGGANLRAPAIRTLDTSFRVPADLLRLAAPFAPDASLVPAGVRDSLRPPTAIATGTPLLDAARLAAGHPDDTVGIIVPDSLVEQMADAMAAVPGTVDCDKGVVPLSECRGLEFGHVVVVEPAQILSEGGPGGLYIALTRAVKTLTIVHMKPLPGALAERLLVTGS